MTWEKSWCGIREKIKEEKKEKMNRLLEIHWGSISYTWYLILLKRFQWNDSNHILKTIKWDRNWFGVWLGVNID
jgi:hypothetical protein